MIIFRIKNPVVVVSENWPLMSVMGVHYHGTSGRYNLLVKQKLLSIILVFWEIHKPTQENKNDGRVSFSFTSKPWFWTKTGLLRNKVWAAGTGLRHCSIFFSPTNLSVGWDNIVLWRRPVPPVQNFFSSRIFSSASWGDFLYHHDDVSIVLLVS